MQAPRPPPPPPQITTSVPGSISMNQSFIKPTRAGLLDYNEQPRRALDSLSLNKNLDALGSQVFKDELLERHLRFSNLESSGQSIEDRIRANREQNAPVSHEDQTSNMSDRLMQSCKLERKPFAYSPDMTDPNNRGKLNLAQIKSPAMRRRLMVNMKSSSGSYDDCESNEIEVLNYSSRADTVPSYNQPVIIHHPPTTEFYGQPVGNSSQTPDLYLSQLTPTIQYNEAPQFYNSSYNDRVRARGTQSADPIASATQQESDERYARLGAELVESLESLSLMVSKLNEPSGGSKVPDRPEQRRHNSQPPANYMTTFSNDTSQLSNQINHSQRNFSSTTTQDRQLVDEDFPIYGNQYFTTASTNGPYLASPFYGDPLDIQHCTFAPISSLPSPRQVLNSTFLTASTTNR